MSISASLLSATIWKLKSAKVDKTDTGHLNLLDASILLILQILMIATGMVTILFFENHSQEQIYVDTTRDVIDFLIAVLYFKMITNFITKFKLQTKVNKDESIDIVGIDKAGIEIFKFRLDVEQHHKLLGIMQPTTAIAHRRTTQKKPSNDVDKAKVGYEEVMDDYSANDFSDSASNLSMSKSGATGVSFVSDYDCDGRGAGVEHHNIKASPSFGGTNQDQINMKFFAEEKAKKEGDSSPRIINNRETFGKAMIEQHSNGPLSHTYASQKGKKNAMLLAINDDNEDSD